MKKILKITGIAVLSILLILYLSFLFILPNAINLNDYKKMAQDIIKENTNLILDFENAKISVTPLLSAGIKATNLSIKLPDNSDVLTADEVTTRISLPHLLFLTVQVSKAEIINPNINIDIINGDHFAAVKAYEEILNKKEENIEQAVQSTQAPAFDMSLIKIFVPKLLITDYDIKINDLKTNNNIKLRGDELALGYRNGKSVYLKTNAEFFANEEKNITANIDIDTFLPQASKLDKEDDKAQRIEIPFVNPVSMYMEYDLKTNIDSKIKIRTKDNKIVSKGHFNIDNFSLKLAGLELPESKFHLMTKGTKVNLDTDLHINKEDKISVVGMVDYNKKPAMNLALNSTEIKLNDVLTLVKATLDSLHINHSLNHIFGEGFFVFDTKFKTDFKKLNSSGNIAINNCAVNNTRNNKQLAKVNSIISLDNNTLKFIDTFVEIAEASIKIDGSIDEASIADISLEMEKFPIENIFSMLLPQDISKGYVVNNGHIDLNAYIKGELKKAQGNATLTVNNLSLTDKINKINYLNNTLIADFKSDFKAITGSIKNSDFRLSMNGANVSCENFLLSLTEKDIEIQPSKLTINDSTIIDFSGLVKNYEKNPNFKFDAVGKLLTKDLKQLLGKDLELFIHENGTIPLTVNIEGDSKKQVVIAQIEADKNNFMTPIDFDSLIDKDTILKTVIDLKGDRLKIKDTGFFIKRTEQDPKNQEKTITVYDEIISVDGTITKLNTSNPNINLLKVKMPKELKGTIFAFPESKVNVLGGLFAFGDLVSPRVRGEFNIWDLTIPELMLTMDRASAKFEGEDLDINIKNFLANGSDYNGIIKADLKPSANFTIKNLNLISNLTDADKLMLVSDKAMKYFAPSSSQQTTTQAPQSADIPVVIKDGTIDMKEIKSGTITLNNTTGKISLFKNIFYINNLMTDAFKGKVKGDVSMNLVNGEIVAKVKGNGLDVEKTLLDAAAMKDTLTGTMDFNANISLKGATYEEQMKTLKGNVDFTMKEGDLGPFGKIENLILAENIRESAVLQSTVGQAINSLLSFDTAKYNELNGKLTFKNGVAEINPISTTGDVMATYIFGNFDLLKNTIDIKLRGRLGSQISDSMGPIAYLNPINLVKATPGMSIVLGKIFFLFTEVVTENEFNQIPTLGKDISDTTTTKFQVVIRGDVAKPLTLVKSFKWLALETDMAKAQDHMSLVPEGTVPELNIPGVDLSTMSKEEIKQQVKEQAKKQVETTVEETKKEVKKQVQDTINNNLTKEEQEVVSKTISTVKEQQEELKTLTEGKTKEEAKEIVKENIKNKLKDKAKKSLLDLMTVPETSTETQETTSSN